jgi:hypothetical protein
MGKMAPMGIPPEPGIPDLLLAVARRLGWIFVSGEYGRIEGYELSVCAGDVRGSVRWYCDPKLLECCGPRLLSRAAYEALRTGELLTDGTLMVDGRRFRLADVYMAHGYAAELVSAGA